LLFMLYDLATWTFLLLMLWAGGAALIVYGGKPVPKLLPPKNPPGFMPPPA
jgi:hypothetical protein